MLRRADAGPTGMRLVLWIVRETRGLRVMMRDILRKSIRSRYFFLLYGDYLCSIWQDSSMWLYNVDGETAAVVI